MQGSNDLFTVLDQMEHFQYFSSYEVTPGTCTYSDINPLPNEKLYTVEQNHYVARQLQSSFYKADNATPGSM